MKLYEAITKKEKKIQTHTFARTYQI